MLDKTEITPEINSSVIGNNSPRQNAFWTESLQEKKFDFIQWLTVYEC